MNNRFAKLKSYTSLVALALWSLVPAALPTPAQAAAALSGSSALTGTYGNAIAITDLQISDTAGATEQVRLTVTGGSLAMTTTTGLTFTGGTTGAQLKFSGVLANVNAALATLQYTRTAGSIGSDTLEVTLVGANQVYYPATGHLYEYVTSDGARTWTAAKGLADARTAAGANGYLATMTSDAENTFISDRLTGAGWMGASDGAVEGDWKWVDGPETGTSFWSGLAANNVTPGSPVGGQYNKWNTGEPNNAGNEDCGQFLSGTGGQWNDLPCTVTTLAGYVVEYGAPGNLPAVASKNIALTVTGGTQTVSTCTALNTLGQNANTRFATINLTADIDCAGVANFSPLYYGTDFAGTFNGHGHKITGLTINRPTTDYQGLFAHASGTIQDLVLASGSVTGRDYTGGLAGEVSGNITISGVVSHLTVSGRANVGGLIGSLYTSTAGSTTSFVSSSATGNVTATGTFVGGFIGIAAADNSSALFSQVFATGNVTTTSDSAGGLIGFARTDGSGHVSSLTVQDAYARGNVNVGGNNTVGGLVANIQALGGTYTASITLERTYATGTLTGNSHIGGLTGYVYDNGGSTGQVTINRSFATGHITTNTPGTTGSLVGVNNIVSPRFINSAANYYDGPGTGLSNCSTANIALANCTRINTATQPLYFKGNHTNAPLTTWDFDSIWVVNPGTYPTFAATDDGDGITTAEENVGPNSGDANGDGTLDSVQAEVASFTNAVTGQYAVLESSCGSLYNVAVGAENTTAGQTDIAYSYPGGLVRFVAVGCAPGATATITQTFFGLSSASQFIMRKSGNGSYTTVPGAVFSAVTTGGQAALKAVYQVTDGSSLDQDGLADGTIVDPAGPALGVLGVPSTGLGGLRR